MARREPAALIESVSTRLRTDYLLAVTGVAAVALALWKVGHLDPVGDTTSRRIVYAFAAASALGLAWAVYTWVNATYSDSSPRMVRVRARQGKRIRAVRYRLIFESIVVSVVSVIAIVVDVDGTWRVHVFYLWLAAVLAAAIGLWRALWLDWRLKELRERDDIDADGPAPMDSFTWRRSA